MSDRTCAQNSPNALKWNMKPFGTCATHLATLSGGGMA